MFDLPLYVIVLSFLTFLYVIVHILVMMSWRVVVPTNYVHIVQSSKKTTSYGVSKPGGNTYYKVPAFIPKFGVNVSVFPVSNFQIYLKDFDAFDIGRVPFLVDIMAFFHISNSDKAAERVANFEELQKQLIGIVQGAVRSILANAKIEDILGERALFGQKFTEAVSTQLAAWGVETVKALELMDMRDAKTSQVIHNIQLIKESDIERDSRTKVAKNTQMSKTAEIEATQAVGIAEQVAAEQVGIRTAEKDEQVGIRQQQAQQRVAEESKNTATANMEVTRVNSVKQAEITRDVEVVKADQIKQVNVKNAEGEGQAASAKAAGVLEATKFAAEGITAEGVAKAKAAELLALVPVTAQAELAKATADNKDYVEYLVRIRGVEKEERVGIAQAEALKNAKIQIVATPGSNNGVFSAGGGVNLGAMLAGLAATESGKAVLDKLGIVVPDTAKPANDGTGDLKSVKNTNS